MKRYISISFTMLPNHMCNSSSKNSYAFMRPSGNVYKQNTTAHRMSFMKAEPWEWQCISEVLKKIKCNPCNCVSCGGDGQGQDSPSIADAGGPPAPPIQEAPVPAPAPEVQRPAPEAPAPAKVVPAQPEATTQPLT